MKCRYTTSCDHSARKLQGLRGQPRVRARQHLTVTDAEGLDPALLPQSQRDEEAQLHELLLAEVAMQLGPQRVVRQVRVPQDCAGPPQGGFLAFVEGVRGLKLEQLEVLIFCETFLSGPDRSLIASVAAIDGLRNVDAAHLLDRVVADAVSKNGIPSLGEGAQHRRHVRPDGLALGPRGPVDAGVLEITGELGIG